MPVINQCAPSRSLVSTLLLHNRPAVCFGDVDPLPCWQLVSSRAPSCILAPQHQKASRTLCLVTCCAHHHLQSS